MKVAATADLHLTTREKHPERYHALENILTQVQNMGLQYLLLAGDTFDESSRNYAEFDNFCKAAGYSSVQFIVVRGNHDVSLEPKSFTASNIRVVNEAEIWLPGQQMLPWLLLPFAENQTMGEFIAGKSAVLAAGRWILVGHGDWSDGMYEPNPSEPGVYMPLTRTDIENYQPALALLGHIHKPIDGKTVFYVGSPCGLDIRETGRRRFVVIDCETATVESLPVDTDYLYFNESFVVLPIDDEIGQIKTEIERRIQSWQLLNEERPKVRVQVKIKGYSTNKRQLNECVQKCFADFAFYRDGEPDLDEVYTADDSNLAEIALRVKDGLEGQQLQSRWPQPDRQEILLQALHAIYGS